MEYTMNDKEGLDVQDFVARIRDISLETRNDSDIEGYIAFFKQNNIYFYFKTEEDIYMMHVGQGTYKCSIREDSEKILVFVEYSGATSECYLKLYVDREKKDFQVQL